MAETKELLEVIPNKVMQQLGIHAGVTSFVREGKPVVEIIVAKSPLPAEKIRGWFFGFLSHTRTIQGEPREARVQLGLILCLWGSFFIGVGAANRGIFAAENAENNFAMPEFFHQNEDWPNFFWDKELVLSKLAAVRHSQGKLLGRMDALGFEARNEAVLEVLTGEIVKSSEIEGERLAAAQVRSSVARRLGLDIAGEFAENNHQVEGVVEMMLDATQKFDEPLTEERLFSWHAALFPTGRSGLRRMKVGAWRTAEADPMQVVSGALGKEKVHFVAPESVRLPGETRRFLEWFNKNDGMDFILRALIAHLWFVTLHPFEDGNGRIARAIADMMLARSDGSPLRFYSMSAQIRAARKHYYIILEKTQKGEGDITKWLLWGLECIETALGNSARVLSSVLAKADFWRTRADVLFNSRQRLMLNKLLDGFHGQLTTLKWARITKTSKDTALRDIQDLMGKNILRRKNPGGRSTAYELI